MENIKLEDALQMIKDKTLTAGRYSIVFVANTDIEGENRREIDLITIETNGNGNAYFRAATKETSSERAAVECVEKCLVPVRHFNSFDMDLNFARSIHPDFENKLNNAKPLYMYHDYDVDKPFTTTTKNIQAYIDLTAIEVDSKADELEPAVSQLVVKEYVSNDYMKHYTVEGLDGFFSWFNPYECSSESRRTFSIFPNDFVMCLTNLENRVVISCDTLQHTASIGHCGAFFNDSVLKYKCVLPKDEMVLLYFDNQNNERVRELVETRGKEVTHTALQYYKYEIKAKREELRKNNE